jgi:tetratricopeptide (TPR) repeat protein
MLCILGWIVAFALITGLPASSVASPDPLAAQLCNGPFKSDAPEASAEAKQQAAALLASAGSKFMRWTPEEVRDVDRATLLDPRSPDAWKLRADIAREHGSYGKELAYRCEVFNLGVRSWSDLSLVLNRIGRFDREILVYRKELENNLENPGNVYRLLGHSLWGTGDRKGAIEAFAKGAVMYTDENAPYRDNPSMRAARIGGIDELRKGMVGYANDVRREQKLPPLTEAEVLALGRGEPMDARPAAVAAAPSAAASTPAKTSTPAPARPTARSFTPDFDTGFDPFDRSREAQAARQALLVRNGEGIRALASGCLGPVHVFATEYDAVDVMTNVCKRPIKIHATCREAFMRSAGESDVTIAPGQDIPVNFFESNCTYSR